MKRVILFAIFIAVFTSFTKGQQLYLSGQLGYAIGESKTWKKFMLLTGGDVGLQWELNYKVDIKVGLGFNKLSFTNKNDTGAAVFVRKNMAFLPVALRRKYQVSRTSLLYLDFGIRNSFYFHEKSEVFGAAGKINHSSNLSTFNTGLLVGMGLITPVSSKWNFDIAIGGHADLFSFSKKSSEEFKATSNILNTTFSRRL